MLHKHILGVIRAAAGVPDAAVSLRKLLPESGIFRHALEEFIITVDLNDENPSWHIYIFFFVRAAGIPSELRQGAHPQEGVRPAQFSENWGCAHTQVGLCAFTTYRQYRQFGK